MLLIFRKSLSDAVGRLYSPVNSSKQKKKMASVNDVIPLVNSLSAIFDNLQEEISMLKLLKKESDIAASIFAQLSTGRSLCSDFLEHNEKLHQNSSDRSHHHDQPGEVNEICVTESTATVNDESETESNAHISMKTVKLKIFETIMVLIT
ncbi:Uncharacterised protein at_DN2133 [Pycnogonum litorale]